MPCIWLSTTENKQGKIGLSNGIKGKESKKPRPNLPAADNTAVVGDSTAEPVAAVVVVQVLDWL